MKVKTTFINFTSILIYLLPLSLLTGSLLPDLIISFVALFFIFYTIIEKEWKYYRNNFFYLFLGFYLYLIFNSLISTELINSLKSSLFYFRFGVFALAVWFLLEKNKYFLKYASVIFMLTFLIAITDGYIQFLYDVNLLGIHYPGVRMTLLFNDKLFMGGYIARLFPLVIALYLLQAKNYRLNKYVFVVIFGFLLIATDILAYISGERTAFGLLFVFTIFLILFTSSYKVLRIITFLLSILIIILLTIFNADVRDRNIDQTINQITESKDNEFDSKRSNSMSIRIFSQQHESLYITSWNMFKNNPIFGLGINSFRNFCHEDIYSHDSDSCSTHPHNSYLQLLAETGLTGLIFIIILFIYLMYQITKLIISDLKGSKRHLEDYQICLLGCFLISLWPFLPTQNFFNNWINIVYYLPIGFYLYSLNLEDKNI